MDRRRETCWRRTANAIEAGQEADHCTAAMPRSRIADAPETGLGIAETSDFDRAPGFLVLTPVGSGNRRPSSKQIKRADKGEQKRRRHDEPPLAELCVVHSSELRRFFCRSPKLQPYFQSAFPYEHDQWMSAAATARAVMALAPAAR